MISIKKKYIKPFYLSVQTLVKRFYTLFVARKKEHEKPTRFVSFSSKKLATWFYKEFKLKEHLCFVLANDAKRRLGENEVEHQCHFYSTSVFNFIDLLYQSLL